MDMVKMGSFLAELRKEHEMTQAELGEKLGVTNKTVSRWETGNYMPPVEMLEELSSLYGLTINELLEGRKLSTEEFKKAAETNIKETLKASTFDLKEKQEFFTQVMRASVRHLMPGVRLASVSYRTELYVVEMDFQLLYSLVALVRKLLDAM